MNGNEIAKLKAECSSALADRALDRYGIKPKLSLPPEYADERVRER